MYERFWCKLMFRCACEKGTRTVNKCVIRRDVTSKLLSPKQFTFGLKWNIGYTILSTVSDLHHRRRQACQECHPIHWIQPTQVLTLLSITPPVHSVRIGNDQIQTAAQYEIRGWFRLILLGSTSNGATPAGKASYAVPVAIFMGGASSRRYPFKIWTAPCT